MKPATLTIDNGPVPEVTPGVLDTLARRGVKASFFVLGRRLEDPVARRVARRARDEGHWLGNHSYSHATPLGLMADAAASVWEIRRTQELLGPLADERRLFRPFGGGGELGPHLLSPAALRYLAEGGFSCVLWNAVPGDWKDPDGWPETALAQMAALAHPVLVLHDMPGAAAGRLDDFLAAAEDAGYAFVQDFPAEVIVVDRGRITPEAAACVAA